MNKKLYTDFDIFTRALVNSRDVDPIYPVLKNIIQTFQFEPEWFTFVYVAFYNIESAIRMCNYMKTTKQWDEGLFRKLRQQEITKFGHERRGTARNVDNQVRMFNDIVKFIEQIDNRKNPKMMLRNKTYYDTNHIFQEAIQSLPFHSVWSSFKIAEIFEKSLGYEQFKIKDLGITGKDTNSTDGTIAGLRLLFGSDFKYNTDWYEIWNKFGIDLSKAYNYDIGEIETCFCKFNKLYSGNYYIGHDIDEFFELKVLLGKSFYWLVENQFDYEVKELNKKEKTFYKNTGNILNSEYAIHTPSDDVIS